MSIKNSLRADPTRTTMLRKQLMGELHKRFRSLKGAINTLIITDDAFGLLADERAGKQLIDTPDDATTHVIPLGTVLNNLTNNITARWRFETDANKVKSYQTWLKAQVDAGILETAGPTATPWTDPYIQSAYTKGGVRAYTDSRDLTGGYGDGFYQGSKEEFLRSAFAGPIATGKLELLGTRAFSQLKGVTDDMEKEMTRVLSDGIAHGHGARKLARELNKTVDKLERTRARTIARTEIVNAHAEGQLDAFEALGVEEVGVMAEWHTAGDDRVCPLCLPLENIILTVKEARGMIPRHPNCRCAWIPANVGEHKTGKQNQTHSKDEIDSRIRKSLRAEKPKLSTKEARAASRWVGADKKITGKLKPGSAKALAAEAGVKQAAAVELAKKKAIAEEQAAAAKVLQGQKVKVGMVKKKYGLTDDMLYYGESGDELPKINLKGINDYASKHKVTLTVEHKLEVSKAASLAGKAGQPVLAAQMEVLDDIVQGILAKYKFMQDAKKGVAAWGKQATAEVLDHADYKNIVGWGAPAAGKTQSYGVLVFDDFGNVLMRKPTGHYNNTHWTFAKGGGTKPGTTALAELGEETGYKATIHDVLPGDFVGDKTKTNYFLGKPAGFDPGLMDAETSATKWMTYEDALKAIAESTNPVAVARDTKVLEAAYAALQNSDGKLFAALVKDGGEKVAAAKQVAAKAEHAHKVKVGMAKKHYAKDKFGGGVVDMDWVNPANKTKLQQSGVDKVLSEKGWHTTTLPKTTTDAIMMADDVVAQKAIMDGLKKAPKGTPKPWAGATKPPATHVVPMEGDLTKVADLPGSTRPYLAKDGAGKKWVVKDSSGSNIAPGHLRSEAMADDLYRVLDIPVPDGAIIDAAGGPMKITEFLEGGQTLADWKVGKTLAEIEDMHKQIRKGFVADALFANHDVIGLSNDNIFIVAGKAYRIDNGGALAYRAQGAAKRTWGNTVTELDSMRDAAVNPNTSAIYKGLTDADIEQQIRQIVGKRDNILMAITDDDVRAVMAARIDDLAAKLPATRTRRAVPTGRRRAEYGNTPEVAVRAKTAKSNGVNIAGDRDLIEDNNILVWEELGIDGKPITRLQLKVTEKGSDSVIRELGTDAIRNKGKAKVVTGGVHPDDVYWDTVQAAVKTINHHAGDGLYNKNTINNMLTTKLKLAEKSQWAMPSEKKMFQHYIDIITEAEDAMRKGTNTKKVYQYTTKPAGFTKPVGRTNKRPMRIENPGFLDLPTTKFKGGVGKHTQDTNRIVSRDVFTIDAGDGMNARFIPNDGGFEEVRGRAIHGTISVEVPGEVTPGNIQKALDMVNDMGVSTAAPTPAYEEALYLHRGVYINKKHTKRSYKDIWNNVTLTDEERVVKMKAWIKDEMKIDVDKVPSYNPAGVTRHIDGSGYRHWERWDLPEAKVREEMADYTLFHSSGSLHSSPFGRTADTLDAILESGGEFTTTTGRIRKGVHVVDTGGASASADINSGGASYFFTRIKNVKSSENGFCFRPSLLARQDAISYDSDRYGRISDLADRVSTTTKYKKYANIDGNETIFKEGLSFSDIDFIRIRDKEEYEQVLGVFKKHGIEAMPDGRPVSDIVVMGNAVPKKRNL